MLRPIVILTILTVQLLYAVPAKPEELALSLAEALDHVVTKELEQSGTPSLQVAVAKGNRIIYQGAFGYADIENETLASYKTRYRTASVAKWFTATLALRLYEQGKIDLDSPAGDYCPAYFIESPPEREGSKGLGFNKTLITARQLLTHTAGIRGYIDFEERIESAPTVKAKSNWRLRQLQTELAMLRPTDNVIEPISRFRKDPFDFEPGTDWQYTSFGYRLLSCVLQGAADQEFSELMVNEVFSPAGMTDTVPDDARKIIAGRAEGYELGRDQSIRRAKYRDVSENLAAGGYLATATDLVKFSSAFNQSLISSESKKSMQTAITLPSTDVSWEKSWRDAIPTKGKYGHGLMLFSNYREDLVGHTGRQDGGSAILVLSPDEQISIAVMTNAKGWNGYLKIITAIFAALDEHGI